MAEVLSYKAKVFTLQGSGQRSELSFYNEHSGVGFRSCFVSCSRDDECSGFDYRTDVGSCNMFNYLMQLRSAGISGIGENLIYFLNVNRFSARGELSKLTVGNQLNKNMSLHY